jgi:hypothetical protein
MDADPPTSFATIMVHLRAASQAVSASTTTMSKTEALLVAHWAAQLYDQAATVLATNACAGTYWRRDLRYQERAHQLVATRGRKRGRPLDVSVRECQRVVRLSEGPVDDATGQSYRICGTCVKAWQADEEHGLL